MRLWPNSSAAIDTEYIRSRSVEKTDLLGSAFWYTTLLVECQFSGSITSGHDRLISISSHPAVYQWLAKYQVEEIRRLDGLLWAGCLDICVDYIRPDGRIAPSIIKWMHERGR